MQRDKKRDRWQKRPLQRNAGYGSKNNTIIDQSLCQAVSMFTKKHHCQQEKDSALQSGQCVERIAKNNKKEEAASAASLRTSSDVFLLSGSGPKSGHILGMGVGNSRCVVLLNREILDTRQIFNAAIQRFGNFFYCLALRTAYASLNLAQRGRRNVSFAGNITQRVKAGFSDFSDDDFASFWHMRSFLLSLCNLLSFCNYRVLTLFSLYDYNSIDKKKRQEEGRKRHRKTSAIKALVLFAPRSPHVIVERSP
jgi:hypothetical protein